MKEQRLEKGQALVLIVLAIVGILGFAALAVDFGKYYSDRRMAQNAADAAALAAGFSSTRPISGLTPPYTPAQIDAAVIQAATDSLTTNGFVNTPGTVDIQINHPPASGEYIGLTNYYQVIIHGVVDKVFSQFVYTGPFEYSVESVTRVNSTTGAAGPSAIRVLAPDECGALTFDGGGNGSINIKDGNITVDSIAGNCPNHTETRANCDAAVRAGHGSSVITITNGALNTSGTTDGALQPGLYFQGTTNTCQPQAPVPSMPKPDCSYLPVVNQSSYSGTVTLQPGQYINGVNGNNVNIHLTPGMYCFYSDFQLGAQSILTGQGVMIYMEHGNFIMGAQTQVNLIYSTSLPDHSLPGWNWAGLLLYMPLGNDGYIQAVGGVNSQMSGTIFAPKKAAKINQAKCEFGGNTSSFNLDASIICYDVTLHGGVTMTVDYNQSHNFQFPASLDQMK